VGLGFGLGITFYKVNILSLEPHLLQSFFSGYFGFFFKLFSLLLYRGYIVTFRKFLTIYHSWIHQSFSFIFPPLIPGIDSIGLIFLFTYMCTEYFHDIHFSTPFPYILPAPSYRNGFAFMFSVFVKRKTFLLFKIAIQGVSLWHFHVDMYYNPNCLCFLLSTWIPVLW
jgi:hypothetical protein